jgi:RNA-binding protein
MLTGKQKRYLRGLGHNLKPVIVVGKGGVSDSLIREADEALESHELIKVKILEGCLMDRNEVSTELAEACNAQCAQLLGRTILLYRRAKEAKIELPKKLKAED